MPEIIEESLFLCLEINSLYQGDNCEISTGDYKSLAFKWRWQQSQAFTYSAVDMMILQEKQALGEQNSIPFKGL